MYINYDILTCTILYYIIDSSGLLSHVEAVYNMAVKHKYKQ